MPKKSDTTGAAGLFTEGYRLPVRGVDPDLTRLMRARMVIEERELAETINQFFREYLAVHPVSGDGSLRG